MEAKPVDISRWNRKQRREVKKNSHITVPGRNLPYQKSTHGSISAYNELRDKELIEEKKP